MDFPPRRPTQVRPRRSSGRSDAGAGDSAEQAIDPEPRGARRLERARPRPPSELAQKAKRSPRSSETLLRLLWAIPLIIVAIFVVGAGGIVFALAMVALAIVGLIEFFRIVDQARPYAYAGFVAAVALIVAARFGTSFQVLLVLGGSFVLVFGFAVAREQRSGVTYSMAVTMFGILWIGVPLAHAVLLRDLPLHGGALMFDVLLATFLADTFAYMGGRLFGRTPLAPAISPSKTVEGLVIGFIGGTATLWIAGLYQDWLSGLDALILGASVALVAPIGDLFESTIKRDFGVKDTGKVFGPHGGALDRMDAALFTIVIGYYVSLALVF